MTVLLNLFFDDYGLKNSIIWVLIAFVICIINIIIMNNRFNIANDDDFQLTFKILTDCFLFFALYYSITSINPYNYIPIIGTDIQKANLKRCTVGKSVNLDHEYIRNIMADCKKKDQELQSRPRLP